MYCVPAVALVAAGVRIGGFHLVPVFLVPLLGMYFLGRVHGYRTMLADLAKIRNEDKDPKL